jgi:hypothetical protein
MSDGSDDPLQLDPLRTGFSFALEAMEVTEKSKTSEAGRGALIARAEALAAKLPPVVAEPQRRTERGSTARSKNDGVNFHIELTVTRGEHAHLFKFDCGDSHVTAAGKGLVRMRGGFEHLRKDQVSALGNLITDFVCDIGLILLREKR